MLRRWQVRIIFGLALGAALLLFIYLPAFLIPQADIQAAVFRYQIEQRVGSQFQVYCLSLSQNENKDPDNEFMLRFVSHQPPVKKASECRLAPDSTVKDKVTGGAGVILKTGNISVSWLNLGQVEITGGNYMANLGASGHTYKLARENNLWIVKEDTLNWIS